MTQSPHHACLGCTRWGGLLGLVLLTGISTGCNTAAKGAGKLAQTAVAIPVAAAQGAGKLAGSLVETAGRTVESFGEAEPSKSTPRTHLYRRYR